MCQKMLFGFLVILSPNLGDSHPMILFFWSFFWIPRILRVKIKPNFGSLVPSSKPMSYFELFRQNFSEKHILRNNKTFFDQFFGKSFSNNAFCRHHYISPQDNHSTTKKYS